MNIQLGQPGRKNRAFNIRIDDFDVWSLDDTLANIIHPALIRLKSRVKHFGYPTPYEETDLFAQHDIQGSFDFVDWNAESEYWESLWMERLDKMIDAFDLIKRKWDLDHCSTDWDDYGRRVDEGLELFSKHYEHLWD